MQLSLLGQPWVRFWSAFARTWFSSPEVTPLENLEKTPESEPACFPLDTYVHTDQGTLEIQYIEVGTLVLARSDVTGEQAYRRVVKTFVHRNRQTYRIDYVTPEGETDTLYATPEHPFWVKDHGWTPAGRLQSGHVLEICDPDGYDEGYRRMGSLQELALSGGRWSATVVSVAESDLVTTVYNFEVEEFHTYFVGVFGVWVHNNSRLFPAAPKRNSVPLPLGE
jgi:hypothetical protein